MQQGKPSFMAETVAIFRAAHQLIDDEPRILDDPLAVPIIGLGDDEPIEARMQSLQQPYIKRARALVIARSRFTEDELVASAARGVTQYVILGAGLDTSAYRAPPEVAGMRILEVDHPDTQRHKLERLSAAGIEIPGNVRFAGADLNERALPEVLSDDGFDTASPAFFSWLGVCCYLERAAVISLFEFIGSLAPGSQIVFDFLLADSALAPKNRDAISSASKVGRSVGEPWITAFIPEELEDELRAAGFSDANYLGADVINSRYLAGRSDGLIVDRAMPIMSAIV
ncbi:MAG: SAM-dependent methyltransferase [Gammaproteobacteria bacterium]|nr:SAM-dependent methyltransferase [Gammaproteobacteria bacterium]MBT8443592.1 SAM-dependent methyltransferase [Gammaproteobacteria bacterium]NND36217.1 class I SAM-dependent methyltransferase [Gammaproteobacteria bacterium]